MRVSVCLCLLVLTELPGSLSFQCLCCQSMSVNYMPLQSLILAANAKLFFLPASQLVSGLSFGCVEFDLK